MARAAEDIGKWNTYLTSIPVEDSAQWARAAGRTAGVFAAWSARTEATPGPLAAAARALSESAQIPAHQRVAPEPDRLHAGGAALIVMQTAMVARGGAAANALLLRQMMRTMGAFADAERAAGRAQHAQIIAEVQQRELTELHARWQASAGAQSRREAFVPDAVTPAAAVVDTAPRAAYLPRPAGVNEEEWKAHLLARIAGRGEDRGRIRWPHLSPSRHGPD